MRDPAARRVDNPVTPFVAKLFLPSPFERFLPIEAIPAESVRFGPVKARPVLVEPVPYFPAFPLDGFRIVLYRFLPSDVTTSTCGPVDAVPLISCRA